MKSITLDPPLLTPIVQDRPTEVAVLAITFSARFYGASGLVIIFSPLPGSDSVEFPYALVAIILAYT